MPVIVRVLRDTKNASLHEIDKKIFAVTGRRLESGGVILVAVYQENYDRMLERIAVLHPQLVILDSPADLEKIQGTVGARVVTQNACGSDRNCPAFIPPWVLGDQLEATKLVLAEVVRPSQ